MKLPAPIMLAAVARGLSERHGEAVETLGGSRVDPSRDAAFLIALVAVGRISPALLLLCCDDAEVRAEVLAGYGATAERVIREAARACGCANCREILVECGEQLRAPTIFDEADPAVGDVNLAVERIMRGLRDRSAAAWLRGPRR